MLINKIQQRYQRTPKGHGNVLISKILDDMISNNSKESIALK
jgi:hypothetical protein